MTLPDRLQKCVSPKTQFLRLDRPFRLECGSELDGVEIGYQTWGSHENAAKSAILICHALTGSADVDAWWPGLIGADGAFDLNHDFVICSNILGGCYGTTGPLSSPPHDCASYGSDFPDISVRDMVNLQAILMDELQIHTLHMVIGPSLGGMQALEWAASFPRRVRSMALIGVGGRHSPWCTGVSEAQRAAIKADPKWQGGHYSENERPVDGLAAARMMAICTYRSWQSFEMRFPRKPGDNNCTSVKSYLHHQGRKINERFDANSYIALSEAMHTHDVAYGRGSFEDALQSIEQPALVISVSSDALYPPQEQKILADALPNSEYSVIDSPHGHDGFLIETESLIQLIAKFRRQTSVSQREPAIAAMR